MTVIAGPSGSGKSSLAFDTLCAEGRRLYLDSLSAYARQFLGEIQKPEVDRIEGISPAIAIDQAPLSRNPRSTVGTSTEILDHLRLLYGRIAVPWCPECDCEASGTDLDRILDRVLALEKDRRLMVLAPLARGKKGAFGNLLAALKTEGFSRVRADKTLLRLDEEIVLDPNKPHDLDLVVDRIVMGSTDPMRIRGALRTALDRGEGNLYLTNPQGEDEILFSELASCPKCQMTIPPFSPRFFSFNAPEGACPRCKGLGLVEAVHRHSLINPKKSLLQGGFRPLKERLLDRWHQASARGVLEAMGCDPTTPMGELPTKVLDLLIHGSKGEKVAYVLRSRRGRKFHFNHPIKGIAAALWKKLSTTKSPAIRTRLNRYIRESVCPLCTGKRLRAEARSAKFQGLSFSDLSGWSITDLNRWVEDQLSHLPDRESLVAKPILTEIKHRTSFLLEVGVGYLDLDRLSRTLSGGEAKRIRLARQLGGRMTGVLYVLDEPTIGLHADDATRLVHSLKELVVLGNTVVVVEHDPATIGAADWLVEMGPGAGEQGGEVVTQGKPQEALRHPDSLTGPWVLGNPTPSRTARILKKGVSIKGASLHNLKGGDFHFPSGGLVVLTGVSGSGKSTLLEGVLVEGAKEMEQLGSLSPSLAKAIRNVDHFEKILLIDQSPIGRTPRSNPATYTDLFGTIRKLFSRVPEAQAQGYGPGFFSFNVKGGRCESCKGSGVREIEMHFLPDITVPCPVCKGNRYGPEALAIKYNGLDISEVLNTTVDDALTLFEHSRPVRRRLEVLEKVGLGYMRLGQPATTLSGGEAQRLKLSRHLGKTRKGKQLILLDEPTTGLHPTDIERLLAVFDTLVEEGNSLVVIEHNLQVLAHADWLLELGPRGGDGGGELVAEGAPLEIAKEGVGPTGRALEGWLKK